MSVLTSVSARKTLSRRILDIPKNVNNCMPGTITKRVKKLSYNIDRERYIRSGLDIGIHRGVSWLAIQKIK